MNMPESNHIFADLGIPYMDTVTGSFAAQTPAKTQFSPIRSANFRLVLRRLRAAVAEFPHRDAELPRLVGQVLLNAGAGEDDDAYRQHVKHLIVALERGRLGIFGPIRFEGDLRNLAVVGPAGGDTLGALR